jgi:hypothetical protein
MSSVKTRRFAIIKIASTGKIPKNLQEERPANTAMVPVKQRCIEYSFAEAKPRFVKAVMPEKAHL